MSLRLTPLHTSQLIGSILCSTSTTPTRVVTVICVFSERHIQRVRVCDPPLHESVDWDHANMLSLQYVYYAHEGRVICVLSERHIQRVRVCVNEAHTLVIAECKQCISAWFGACL
jgi:hypothetical protein